MLRLHRVVPRLVLALAVALPACVPPRPACSVAVVPGKPALCVPTDGGDLFVVGLAEGHGWDRGDWVMLDLPREGFDQPVPVAMAVVVERYADVAKVQVLYQREAKALDGAGARKIAKDQRARLGKFVGRISGIDLGQVRIDVGAQDKVLKGDVYQVLSPRDHQAIGRVWVTDVQDQWALGRVLGDKREPFEAGLDAVWLKNATGDERMPVSIVVVNFDAHDAKDADEVKAGRGFAKDLADSLQRAAGNGGDISVTYKDTQVRLGAGEEEGHKEARLIGNKDAADIVVWGSARCDKAACMQPRFTVVNPGKLASTEYRGTEIWVERDRAGFAFKGEAPADPVALAQGILGSVTYRAQRYEDASYYLGRALATNVLRREDEFLDRQRLAHALYAQGLMLSAREQAGKLIERAQQAHDEAWEQHGHGELARVDMLEGNVDAARAKLEAMRTWAEQHRDPNLAYVLHVLAILEAQQGRTDEARRLYEQCLDVARRIGDVEGEAVTLHQIAGLEARERHVDAAYKLYNQALDIEIRIGQRLGQAATLQELASLDLTQGHVDLARNRHEQALEIERSLHDVQGEADSLHELARLDADQGRIGKARERYDESLKLKLGLHDVKGQAATFHQLATLEADQGNVEKARQLYRKSLDIKHRVDDVKGEGATLHELARLEGSQGHPEEARQLYRRALDLERRAHDVETELASTVNLAVMDYQAGEQETGRRALEAALEKARGARLVEKQAGIQNLLAQIDLTQGDLAGARQRWSEALALYQQLKMPDQTDNVAQHLAALIVIEKAADAWKVHAALLAGGGVIVTGILPGGQAEKTGLAPADILVHYDQTRLDKPSTLQQVAETTDPTKPVTLDILRGAQRLTLQVHGGPLGIAIADLPPNPRRQTMTTAHPASQP
jgi:tetratricopeptide (TPR) repeat protein